MIPDSMRIAVLAPAPEETAMLSEVLGAAGLEALRHDNLADLLAHCADLSHCDLALVALNALGSAPHKALNDLRSTRARQLPLLLIAEAPLDDALIATLLGTEDDYLLKPVRRAELVARVRVLLRRTCPAHPAWSGIVFERFTFDPRLLRVTTGTISVELTRKEFELALLLLRNIGRPLSRAYLLELLWPEETGRSSRTLDTHVSRVRSKLHLRPENGYRLSPVYSFGYLLERLAPAAADD